MYFPQSLHYQSFKNIGKPSARGHEMHLASSAKVCKLKTRHRPIYDYVKMILRTLKDIP